MDTAEIEVFLTLAEELHFGRTAARLRVPQPRVSRLIARLERRVGGLLFDRSSRRVRLTPLGEQFRGQVQPGYVQISTALKTARSASHGLSGRLRLGCLAIVVGPALTQLVTRFSAEYPDCRLTMHPVPTKNPFGPLRQAEIDVAVSWLMPGEPDLTAGPAIMYRARALQVGRSHRLARRESVFVEDLGGEEVHEIPPSFPASLYDAIAPPETPSGRLIHRTYPWESDEDVLTAVARGQIVYPGFKGATLTNRPDLAEIPIRDLPPMPFGLIWCTAHENARIRALAEIARSLAPPGRSPALTGDGPPGAWAAGTARAGGRPAHQSHRDDPPLVHEVPASLTHI